MSQKRKGAPGAVSLSRIEVFTQPMEALIAKGKNEPCYGGRFGGKFQTVHAHELYRALYDHWSLYLHDDFKNITEFADGEEEEQKILASLHLGMPIEFEVGKHPLMNVPPNKYNEVMDQWLDSLEEHVDQGQWHGVFDDDGRYVLKGVQNDEKDQWLSVWTKEVYAAVHAARDLKSYQEYMKWSIDDFLKAGL